VQASTSPTPASAFNVAPIVATIIGIPAAAIVLAALSDASLPIVGSGRGALIGLWVLVTLMCSRGIVAMRDRFGLVRSNLVGLPLGLLAAALIFSAFFGWTPLLQPIANAMAGSGQPVSLDRAAIMGVGAIMMVKLAIAWLSYLPRQEQRR
jgi:enoyl-CoA hydratase/carnithine racemase